MHNKIKAFINLKLNLIKYPILTFYKTKKQYLASNKTRWNRFWLLVISLVMILDYLLVCYHVDRSPFDLFPSLPKIDTRKNIDVFVVDLYGQTILKETRLVQNLDNKYDLANLLVEFVLAGSSFENTKLAVPIYGSIRKIWFYEGSCAVDLRNEVLPANFVVKSGSEDLFRQAVEKTIKANIKGIDHVYILENGIVDKKIWDVSTL